MRCLCLITIVIIDLLLGFHFLNPSLVVCLGMHKDFVKIEEILWDLV